MAGSENYVNTSDITLDEYSTKKAVELIPIDVYTALLILVGLSGNVLVIVFFCRHRHRSPTTMLIIAVAVVDAIVCMLMPKNFVILIYPYKFYNSYLCKLNIFTNHLMSILSGCLLFIIAVFRYRGICQPFRPPIISTHAYISMVVAVILTLVLSLPTLLLFESMPITLTVGHNKTITGYDCLLTKEQHLKIFWFIASVANSVTFLFTCVGFVVLYWKIAMAIHEHKKTRRSLIKNYSKCESSVSVTESGTFETSIQYKHKEKIDAKNTEQPGDVAEQPSNVMEQEGKLRPVSMRAVQQTPMLITVTAIHVISYLPYIVISIVNSSKEGTHDEMNVLDQFCLKSYLLTSAINPLVYLFFNKSLRRFVKKKITCH